MSDSPQAVALARSAAEAVRSLNHATLGGDGLDWPAGAHEALGELSPTASRIPQLLGQVGRWLAPALAARRLGCGDRTHPPAPARGPWLFPPAPRGHPAAPAPARGPDPAGHSVIYIGNPSAGVRGILASAVTALGGRPVHGTAALAAQAWTTLAGEAAERGRTPVLIIDEAHLLDHEQLESIRMLTNPAMDSSTPFATILVGQPTLRHNIKLGVLAALDQRITVRYQMKAMTHDETASYIRHHPEAAVRTP